MKYRIGIDLGTNSLGWAAIRLKESGGDLHPGPVLDLGVRIFSDARNPKDKSSNAAERRGPRGMRRNRDRKLMRRDAMLRELTAAGLFPATRAGREALQGLDPWILRARALEEKLDPHEVGRALFHLQQRRGFKSNRKADGGEDGAMLTAINDVKDRLRSEGLRTLGELYGQPRLEQQRRNADPSEDSAPLPQARVKAQMNGSKMAYDYYPDRALILNEFDLIWDAQAAHHPGLMTDEAREAVRGVVSYQRPLKPQRAGKCTFMPEEPRAPKALPAAQRARILQEVNNLTVGATGEGKRVLTQEERGTLVELLARPSSKTAKRTFKAMRKALGLPESQAFNLETAKRDHLQGDTTAAALMQKNAYGAGWLELDRAAQDGIVSRLLNAEQFDDWEQDGEPVEGFGPWLVREHGASEEQARAVFAARLPDAHGKLSKAALDRLVPRMEAGEIYADAATAEFGDHRPLGDGEIHDEALPYYGEVLGRHTAFEKDDPQNSEELHGRVANPTVHVALNELRRVMNDIIKRYGTPEQVVLELARDLPLSDRGMKDLERLQSDNQKANDKRRAELVELGVADTYQNRLKLRLFEHALDSFDGVAVCVFTGDAIAKTDLFTGEVEIEHVLPLSRTHDDSIANKVLAKRRANRVKRNQAPFEAFGHSPPGFDWDAISQRASRLHSSRAWRFDPDAMEQFEERGGFLDRALNDTRYIARLGKEFVSALYGGQGQQGQANQVWAVTGRLTSDLRHHAGFNTMTGLTGGNKKDRTDHRHHAVDALVIALTDRAMVKRAADLAKREDAAAHHEIMSAMAEPLKRYRNEAEDRLSKLVVSHKPDHGHQAAMHNDTAYGLVGEPDAKGFQTVVTRKPLASLEKPAQLGAIVDPIIAQRLMDATEGLSGKDFTTALVRAGEAMDPPVRRVRVHAKLKTSSLVTVGHGAEGEHAKAYKGDGNYCYDIFMGGKGRWDGEVVTTFQAYQLAKDDKEWWREPVTRDGKSLIMRIRKGDMLELEVDGRRRIVQVYQFSDGKINMAEHFEADASSRVKAKELARIQRSPSSLQKARGVLLSVSPSGKVRRKTA